jgi:Winged helix DNA-binding domain
MRDISLRVLNRTLLERQFLLSRDSRSALWVIERLVALQSQEPNWPYIGLWARASEFSTDDLMWLLTTRQVVRTAGIRRTQHLMSSGDFRWLRPTIQPVLDRGAKSRYFNSEISGVDVDELIAVGVNLLGKDTLSRRELARCLAEKWPGRKGRVLAAALELHLPLVHSPGTSAWGRWGSPSHVDVARAEPVIGAVEDSAQPERMIHRYLGAFGPATAMDFQSWSGLTRMEKVFEAMRPGLRVHRTDEGVELFDLPEATLADGDLPAPVRFLPGYDNILLGHAIRTRIVSDEDRKQVMPGGALVRPTFLVDGFVAGVWSLQRSRLLVMPFRPLSDDARAEVATEAERLLEFVAPDAPGGETSIDWM